jgi:hypothetical protein
MKAALNKKAFLATFIAVGFITKVVSEVVHEVFGHGLFVLLFGGKITGLYISVLWPYDFSYISWSLPGTVDSLQRAWITGGGILMCMCLSFITQTFLRVKKKLQWYLTVTLFWFAFWTLVNSTGYLIIGGFKPFGDVLELIRLGVLTSGLSLIIGLTVFALGFVILSWILVRILSEVFTSSKARYGVTAFWLLIPVLVMVMLANPEHRLEAYYIPLSFIPALLSFALEQFLFLPKQKSKADPDDVSEK